MIKALIALLSLSLFSIGCLAIQPPALEAIEENSATLIWPHSVNEDVSGYRVCYGLVSDTSECKPIPVGYETTYTTPTLPSGDYHFYIQGLLNNGVQGEWVLGLTKDNAEFLTIVTQVRPVIEGLEVN